jgi:hypothetical protein
MVKVAKELDAFAFAKQMGPFVLVQRPVPATPRIIPSGPKWDISTAPLPASNVRPDLDPLPFEELLVAMLPPPQRDGTLQLVIGRSPDCDLVVDDAAVSQRHAAILWDGAVGLLRELGSSNGTFLNGLKLGSAAKLRTGDQLSFGQSHFTYLRTSEFHAKLLKAR